MYSAEIKLRLLGKCFFSNVNQVHIRMVNELLWKFSLVFVEMVQIKHFNNTTTVFSTHRSAISCKMNK